MLLGPMMTALFAEQDSIIELHMNTHVDMCVHVFHVYLFVKDLERSLATLLGGKSTWCLLLQNPYDHNPLYVARPKNCGEIRSQSSNKNTDICGLKYDVMTCHFVETEMTLDIRYLKYQ